MKVWRLDPPGSLDTLVCLDEPEPAPGLREVAIRIRAASLNYRDLMIADGSYGLARLKPRPIALSDGVGEVVALGPRVTRVRIGERVAPIFTQRWLGGRIRPEFASSALGGPSDGVLAETVVLSEEGVVRVPEHLTDEQAATLPCAAVTAWHALVVAGGLAAGETVLTLGTGGVSLFAAQFALACGARVIATTGSDAKGERLRALGVRDVINYSSAPDWERGVRELTGGEGVDHVVEVGGAGTFERSLASVRMGGHVHVIGNLAGAARVDPGIILRARAHVHGIQVGSREMFEAMNRAIAHARIVPVVDRVFAFDEVHAAYRHLASRRHVGKIVVRGA
jgi:NADPH:quinone reductase-like Zn-dependent oxidoreductase